jgi:hypothetical protein
MPKFPSKIFVQDVKNLDDEAFKRGNDKGEQVNLTLQFAVRSALTANLAGPGGADPEENKKYELFELARKVNKLSAKEDTEIELSSEDITLILGRVKKVWPIEAYGFIYDVLEQKNGHAPPASEQ